MTFNDVFENFIYKHKVKGNKGNTRVNYYYHLLPFFKFLGNEYQIEDITTETVLEYVDTLPDLKKKNGDNYSEGSLSSFLRTLKIFCKWLNERYQLNIYTKDIPNKPMPARECPIYTDDEIIKILDACKSPFRRLSVGGTNSDESFDFLYILLYTESEKLYYKAREEES